MSHSSAFADQCDRSNEDEQFFAPLSVVAASNFRQRASPRVIASASTPQRSISKSSICAASHAFLG
jgi:hypothetical protein